MIGDPLSTAKPPISIGIAWYLAALVAYVILGYFFKGALMHWAQGPLFLLITLYAIPTLARRLRTRTDSPR